MVKGKLENSKADEPISIPEVFKGSTVLVTGATGFLGKLTIEKLLRSCPDIKKIFIIVRKKKEKTLLVRKEETFNNEIFDRLRKTSKKFTEKIELLSGDLTQTNLGLNRNDIKKIITEVNFIFHLAATVNFDEKIRTALDVNCKATKDLLSIAKEMKHLKAFVHVSTAYSNCPQKTIDEKFYDLPCTPEKIIDIVNALDDDKLAAMLPILMEKWPNTYVFTKALAENLIKRESALLPITIIRPSIITSTYKEPIPGWIDNFYGTTGVLMGVFLGLVRILNGNPNIKIDNIPADYVVNCMISSAWDVVVNKNKNAGINENNKENVEKEEDSSVKIYNCISGSEKPITLKNYCKKAYDRGIQIPTVSCLWFCFLLLIPNVFLYKLLLFVLHTMPAHMIDFGLRFLQKKPRAVKGYQKINKFLDLVKYFSCNEWNFINTNTQQLWNKLSKEDKEIYSFSVSNLDWDTYFYSYVEGIRKYLVKDPMETVESGKKLYKKLKFVHYITLIILILVTAKIVTFLVSCAL